MILAFVDGLRQESKEGLTFVMSVEYIFANVSQSYTLNE